MYDEGNALASQEWEWPATGVRARWVVVAGGGSGMKGGTTPRARAGLGDGEGQGEGRGAGLLGSCIREPSH